MLGFTLAVVYFAPLGILQSAERRVRLAPEAAAAAELGLRRASSARYTARALQFLVVVLLLGITQAFATIHPVPLDKNTDSAKCLECHADKSKGKAVHSAIAAGCTVCHEIRVSKDITRVKLTATTPYALCLTCHAEKNAAEIKGTVHSPAVRECLKCHDAHASENKYELLRPTSGGAKENLCLDCHTTGLNVPEKGSRHAALDMGCDSCHLSHKTGPSPDREFKHHLTKATPELCLDCHDVQDINLVKAHQSQPFEKADCLSCHDPHQSDRPKLMQKFVHLPYGEKQCEICHQPAKDGKVVLTQSSGKELCVTCHEEQAKKIASAKVQHPGAQEDCTNCHNPHAGKSPGFPKPDAVNVCLGCHADQAEEAKKHVLHQPAFEQGCATCHEPHGGERPKLLRAENVNSLCLECHGPDSQPQKLEAERVFTIFNGTVKLPDDYFKKNKVAVLPLRFGFGHPVDGHPVSDVADPKDATKVGFAMNCLTCHQPHASLKTGLLVKDQENNMAFCDTCHKNRIDMSK
jgi:predicted CXXCH cytochrome family protein